MESSKSYLHLNLHLKKYLNNQYNDFLISEIFRILSLSMIFLFIPIFLLKLGFSVFEVIFFEFLATIICMIFNILFFRYLLFRLNIKLSLIISYFLYVLFYLILIYSDYFLEILPNKYYYISFVVFFKILPDVMYWMSHHIYFLKSTKSSNTSSKLGLLIAIPTFIGIIGPVLGGFLITKSSFVLTFVVSTIFMILASISLMFSKDIKIKKHKIIWKKLFNFNGENYNKIYVLHGINAKATDFLWPIFLFLISVKILTLGFIYFLTNLIYSFTSYICGKRINLDSEKKFLKFSSIGHGTSLSLRVLVSSIMTITTFQVLGGFFQGILNIVLDSKFYQNAHRFPVEAILNRELYLHLGRVLVLGFLLVLLFFFSEIIAFTSLILICGVLTFGFIKYK